MSKICASTDYLHVDVAVVTAPPFTMHLWAKHTSLGALANIMSLGQIGLGNNRFQLNKSASEVMQAAERDTVFSFANGGTIPDTGWHAYTGVFTSDSSRDGFTDGGSKGSNTTVKTPFTPSTLYLAVPPNTTANGLIGRLAHVAIWNRALTDAEVALLANRSPTLVASSSLVAYYPLLSDALDRYGANDLTVTGSAGYDSADSPTFTWPYELLQHTQKNTGANVASTTLAYARNNIAGTMGYAVVHLTVVTSCTIIDSAGNTWTLIDRQDTASNSVQTFYAKNLIAGANTITVIPGASATLRIGLAEYSGLSPSAPLDVSGKATASGSTAVSVGAITPSKDNDLILLGWGVQSASVLTAGTNYEIEEQIVSGTERAGFEQKLAAAAAAETGTGTLGTSTTWGAVMAAFTSQNPGASPSAGVLYIAGLAPSLYTERVVAPGVGAIGTVGQTPTFPFTTIVPGPGLVSLLGLQITSSIAAGPSGAPDVGVLQIIGQQINVEKHLRIIPDLITGSADEIGLVPNIIQGWLVAPIMAASPVNTVGLQPIIIGNGSVTVNPPVGLAIMAGLAPTTIIPSGQSGSADPLSGQVQMLGLAPSLQAVLYVSPQAAQLQVGSYEVSALNVSRWHKSPGGSSATWHAP